MPVPNPDGESYWVYRDGQSIYLFVVYSPQPCIPIPRLVEFEIGALPAGDYTLFEYWVTNSTTFPISPEGLMVVSEFQFSVGLPPSPVPALTGFALVLLVLMLLAFALWRITKHNTCY